MCVCKSTLALVPLLHGCRRTQPLETQLDCQRPSPLLLGQSGTPPLSRKPLPTKVKKLAHRGYITGISLTLVSIVGEFIMPLYDFCLGKMVAAQWILGLGGGGSDKEPFSS